MSGAPQWAARFIGIPFADQGHDFTGCNCWGLVHLVLKHRAGVDVPTYGEVSASDIVRANALFETEAISGPWIEAGEPLRVFDVVLLRGNPLHAGIVIAENLLLHVWRSPSSAAMRLDHPLIRSKRIACYRHMDLR